MGVIFFEFFTEKSKPLRYKKGEIIIRPDSPPSGVNYIEKGYVRVYFLTTDGEEKLHIIYKPDEVFPLIWAVQGEHKHLFYEAMNEVTLRRVTKEDFLQFIKNNPSTLFELSGRLINVLNVFINRVHNLEITKAYPRVIARLLFLSQRFGEKEGNKVKITAPIKHKDIASSIGLTRETTSREMEKLEKNGLVTTEKQLIIINNVKKLELELEKYGEED